MSVERTSIGHMPEGRWSFDADVTARFDDMLERSIPQYDVMRETCVEIGTRLVRPLPSPRLVVDLGTSRGEAIASLRDRLGNEGHYVGCEVSPPMLDVARRRFERDERVEIESCDLRTDYPAVAGVALTLAILTLQFVPIEHRQRVVRRAFLSSRPGAAMIVVEKVIGAGAVLDDALVAMYRAHKRRAGYGTPEIDRKALSLEGVLVPLTANANESLLLAAGWQRVETFWAWGPFRGFAAIRED